MKQTNPSTLRRSRDPAFLQHYFAGVGLDICCSTAPSGLHTNLFPRVQHVSTWQGAARDALYMQDIADESFDFVHASHVLPEVVNPSQAVARWLDLLKPGGYAIITVPDEDLYGKGKWPNDFNARHRASFTISKDEPALPCSHSVLDMVRTFIPIASCERIQLVREFFDDSHAHIDQTAHGLAECAIEIVLRKREVENPVSMVQRALDAPTTQESIDAGRRALRVYPYRFEVCHWLMMGWLGRGCFEAVDVLLDEAYRRAPDEHLTRLYRALHAISRGRLHEGFRMREELMSGGSWEGRTKAEPPSASMSTKWTGQPLAGKSIVIWSEFGLGDEIFFMRFARVLRERCGAARVTVMCQSALVSLFAAAGEADAVIDVQHAARLPPHDYWVFPHAIPAYLPLELDALPACVPYLGSAAGACFDSLNARPHTLKVGIVFKGAPTHENDSERSLPSLGVLDNVLALDGIEFFSLQKGAGADEAAAYARERSNFHDLGASLHGMDETAAAIAALDLVLTVDTSVAHVAGAMGKPTWLMLPFYGDWRWHFPRNDSPWYPTMRLFRRAYGRDWGDVVASVCDELIALRYRIAADKTLQ